MTKKIDEKLYIKDIRKMIRDVERRLRQTTKCTNKKYKSRMQYLLMWLRLPSSRTINSVSLPDISFWRTDTRQETAKEILNIIDEIKAKYFGIDCEGLIGLIKHDIKEEFGVE